MAEQVTIEVYADHDDVGHYRLRMPDGSATGPLESFTEGLGPAYQAAERAYPLLDIKVLVDDEGGPPAV